MFGDTKVMVGKVEEYEYDGPTVSVSSDERDLLGSTAAELGSGVRFSVGNPPLYPSACALCQRHYASSEGVSLCPSCKTPLTFYDEGQYKYARQLGRLFVPLAFKQVGPITCPICKGRTVKRFLEEHKMCARCMKAKEKAEKQSGNGQPAPKAQRDILKRQRVNV